MPALENARHERFAQELAKGKTADEAYRIAGLTPRPFAAPDGFYVYLLIDPRTDRVFYVGKGKGQRALAHAKAERCGRGINALKGEVLGQLRRAGLAAVVHVLEDGLGRTEALRLERMLIVKAHAVLTNIAMGERSAMERVRAEARDSLAQIIPLCVLLRQRPSPYLIGVWTKVVGGLARISVAEG